VWSQSDHFIHAWDSIQIVPFGRIHDSENNPGKRPIFHKEPSYKVSKKILSSSFSGTLKSVKYAGKNVFRNINVFIFQIHLEV